MASGTSRAKKLEEFVKVTGFALPTAPKRLMDSGCCSFSARKHNKVSQVFFQKEKASSPVCSLIEWFFAPSPIPPSQVGTTGACPWHPCTDSFPEVVQKPSLGSSGFESQLDMAKLASPGWWCNC